MYSAIPTISFFTDAVQNDFWSVLRAILFVGMPFVIIAAAFEYGGEFIAVIRNAFSRRRDDDEHYDI
ncbi:hypothetical protein ACFWMP_31285 [Paenibacillus sp. NPDC058367]|jgi:hypothetical protein|uniref:hypothetical protein n=1 Tax=unclassified Paenibacillus TaxID=185978 RepID=UPI0030F64EEB